MFYYPLCWPRNAFQHRDGVEFNWGCSGPCSCAWHYAIRQKVYALLLSTSNWSPADIGVQDVNPTSARLFGVWRNAMYMLISTISLNKINLTCLAMLRMHAYCVHACMLYHLSGNTACCAIGFVVKTNNLWIELFFFYHRFPTYYHTQHCLVLALLGNVLLLNFWFEYLFTYSIYIVACVL